MTEINTADVTYVALPVDELRTNYLDLLHGVLDAARAAQETLPQGKQ